MKYTRIHRTEWYCQPIRKGKRKRNEGKREQEEKEDGYIIQLQPRYIELRYTRAHSTHTE